MAFPRLSLLALVLCFAGSNGCRGSAEGTEPKPDTDPGTPVSEPDASAVDEIVYHYQDASVPPQHHRSVTITATPTSILRVVDSYGDEIERQETALDAASFTALVRAYEAGGLKKRRKAEASPGCTGGTGESLRVSSMGAEQFAGLVEHCGGEDAADFEGDMDALVSALKQAAGTGE